MAALRDLDRHEDCSVAVGTMRDLRYRVMAVVWNDTFVAVVALMVDVVRLGLQIVQRARTTTVTMRHN